LFRFTGHRDADPDYDLLLPGHILTPARKLAVFPVPEVECPDPLSDDGRHFPMVSKTGDIPPTAGRQNERLIGLHLVLEKPPVS